MQRKLLFLITLVPTLVLGQGYKKHTVQKDGLLIQLSDGVMKLIPLSDEAVRVQWEKGMKEEREFVLINKLPIPVFKVSESGTKLELSTNAITVSFDKQTGGIDYSDNNGKLFLSEKAGSRKLKPDTVDGQNCFIAEQS